MLTWKQRRCILKLFPRKQKIDFALDCSQVKVSIKECPKCFLVFNSIYSTCGSICSTHNIMKFNRSSVFVAGVACGRVSIKRFGKIKKAGIVSVNPFVMLVALASVFARGRQFNIIPNKHRTIFLYNAKKLYCFLRGTVFCVLYEKRISRLS